MNVFQHPESLETLRWRLADAQRDRWGLKQENALLLEQALSDGHAFATLLLDRNTQGQTPFRSVKTWTHDSGGIETVVDVFRGKGRAAAVFQIKNGSQLDWKLSKARLSVVPTGEARPFALRMDRPRIGPAMTGTIAIVVDRSAFLSGNRRVKLALELFREDGSRQVSILMSHRLAKP